MEDIILRIKDITKTFPGALALDNVSLDVQRGSIHALVGENGAGKSTLMNILSGVFPAGTYEGSFFIDGEEKKFNNIRESEDGGVAIVHQELNMVRNLTVVENIFLGREIKKNGVINWDAERKICKELLNMVGLDLDPDMLLWNLGTGVQQLVEIAKALSKDVKILVFDEPTSSLTEEDAHRLLELIRQLKAKGYTCIYISHKLDEVFAISDFITVQRDGKIICTNKTGELTEDVLIQQMVGRSLENRYPICRHKRGEIMFEVKGWTVDNPENPGRPILNNINLHACKGEIVGISGLMGAGRTELAMSIFGAAHKKSSGTLKINGEAVNIKSPQAAIKAGLGYSSEDRKRYGLVLGQTIKSNVSLSNFKIMSKLGLINLEKENSLTLDYTKKLNVKTSSIEQIAKNLSGGNQQKVILAKWMMTKPQVLILDEPTRGIDIGAKYEIYSIMHELVEQGVSIIMISSEMPEIIGVCNRVYIMAEGMIAGELEDGEITQENIMTCIQRGIKK